MNIPKVVKIGPHRYKVVFVLGLDKAGQVLRDKGIINLNEEFMDSEKQVTFMHEVLHAMNNELDEVIIDGLAQQLVQFINENNL